MRVLVFGATGYLGSHVARNLFSSGYEVSGVARTPAAAAKLQAAGVQPVFGDLHDIAGSVALLEKADAILFARSSPWNPSMRWLRRYSLPLLGPGRHSSLPLGQGFCRREPMAIGAKIHLRKMTHSHHQNMSDFGARLRTSCVQRRVPV